MKIQFLGTGAADMPTALYLLEKNTKNKSFRRNSAILLDDTILFDCGPHIIDSMTLFNVDFKKINNLFFTHFHSDHFNESTVRLLADSVEHPITVWCKKGFTFPKISNIVVNYIERGDEIKLDRYKISPLNANHSCHPLHYSIESQDKKLFYGIDGAWFLTDTYNFMREKQYDAMILDSTVGDYEGDYRMAEHNSIPMIRLMTKSFVTTKIIKANTKIILSHIAMSLNKPYEELTKIVEKDGFVVAFDGMILSL